MSPRPPAPPPALRGYTHQRLLGSGGFADVFLYEQHMPRRQVAVKVLLADVVTDAVREQFHAEANLMAQVSTHPSIVSVYQAEIADDGRPYLVMEYCTRANLSERYRQERLSAAEALRIGVRLAAAVETAHRSGILHRDIKPANVLTTEYGWPALTDFGISSATGAGSEAEGMSVPWSAPELFAERPVSDERSDVYSLGATVYTLLARRSPFEQPGGRNGALDLMTRIEREPLPPLRRDDVPPSLEQALARSMAKRPSSRFRSALELARALQQVEIELQLAPTAIDVLEPSLPVPREDDGGEDGHTRIRGLVTIAPQDPVPPTAARRPGLVPAQAAPPALPPAETAARATGHPGSRAPALPVPAVAETVHRPVEPASASAEPAGGASRRPVLLVTSSVLLLALLGVGAATVLGGDGEERRPDETVSETAPVDPGADALVASVPAPAQLTAAAGEAGTTFAWTNPDPREGDSFLWWRTDPGADDAVQTTAESQVVVEAPGRVCVEVLLRRANGRESNVGATGCSS